jgi:cytochrome c peroxidase
MVKRNERIGSSRQTTTALILAGATLLMVAPIGNVIVSGQDPRDTVDLRSSGLAPRRFGASTTRDEGRRLFRKETFGGNGRTCETCHSRKTGTLSPDDVQERLRKNANDPLFIHDGLDEGVSGTSRIANHATVRIERPLPPNVRIAGDPSATSVVLLRGIPGTINTPALDPSPVHLRARTPSDQALEAIHDHAQNTLEPTENSWR